MLETVSGLLWDFPMLILLLGTHLYMSVRTGFIQKKLPLAVKLSLSENENGGTGIGQFSALATSLASTIGTGNILGTATAIAIGGPGAVFWIWFSGIFAVATKYAETYVGVKYRVKDKDGKQRGGAMYALQNGLNMKWLGKVFAFIAAFAALGMGCSLQSNAIAATLSGTIDPDKSFTLTLFGIELPGTAAIITLIIGIIAALVIFGGIDSIAGICEKLVPVMAGLFISACGVILFLNRNFVGESLALILRSAFTAQAGFGGFIGSTILSACRIGVSRGLFSNEAGVGSSPMISASADGEDAVKTSLIASSAVFWDTIVICLITGVTMVSSVLAGGHGDGAALTGSEITLLTFSRIPYIGKTVLSLAMTAFAFSTVLGWSVYGIQSAVFLFGERSALPYRIIWIAVLLISGVADLQTVWSLGEILNALMAIPNIFAMLMLSDVISRETKDYFKRSDSFPAVLKLHNKRAG